jgi:LmbE family N-acetylglucosaminyl deacetylase
VKVAIVAAHADDEILGVGGTVARHVAAGDEVHVFIAADCRAARIGHTAAPQLLPAAREASEVVGGYRLRFLGFAGMTLAASELALNRSIEMELFILRPDVVYTHHSSDPNSDHRALAGAVMVATRPIGPAPSRVLCFETPSSTEWCWSSSFAPNYFVDITSTIETKLAAMACYAAELRPAPHPRNLDALRSRAAFWGQVAGCKYAEPFVLMREVVR